MLRETNFDKQFSVTNEITGPATRILWPNLKATLFYKGTSPSFAGKYRSIVLTQKKSNSHIQSNHPGFDNFGVFKAALFSKSGIRGVNLKIGQIWMKWKIVIKSGPNQTAPKCSTNWQDFFCLCFFSQRLSCQFFLSQHLQWENRKWFQNTFYSKASL